MVIGCGKTEETVDEETIEETTPAIETTAPEPEPTPPPATQPAPPPPSDVKNGLTESQRKQAFWDLVVAQDSGISDAEAYAVVSAKYDVSVNVLRDIAYEGVANNWPVPPAP